MNLHRITALIAPILLLAAAARAQIVTVGPLGSGAQYQEIIEGIAAVPPGGVVLVAAGTYQDVGTLVIDKPMTLLGAGSASTSFEALPTSPFEQPLPMAIRNLAAGQQVAVVGLTLSASALSGSVASSVVVADCAGPVVISDVFGGGSVTTPGVAQIRNSALVTLERCSFVAGTSMPNGPTPGLRVEDSLVHVSDCTITGGSSAAPFGAGPVFDGAPGIVASSSIVRLANSAVTGGDGVPASVFAVVTTITIGGAAVDATESQILVRGGNDNLLQGGKGGVTTGSPVSYGVGGAALQLDQAALASTTPDAVMAAGLDGDNQASTPAVQGAGLHAPLAFPLPKLATVNKLVAPGNAVAFAVAGEPGAVCLSLMSLQQVPAFGLSGIFGVFTLQFSLVVPLATVTLDAAGNNNFSVVLPANPALVGASAHSQAVSFAPSGWIAVSAPTFFAVR